MVPDAFEDEHLLDYCWVPEPSWRGGSQELRHSAFRKSAYCTLSLSVGLDYNNRIHELCDLMESSLSPGRETGHQICPVLVLFLNLQKDVFQPPQQFLFLYEQVPVFFFFPIFNSIWVYIFRCLAWFSLYLSTCFNVTVGLTNLPSAFFFPSENVLFCMWECKCGERVVALFPSVLHTFPDMSILLSTTYA